MDLTLSELRLLNRASELGGTVSLKNRQNTRIMETLHNAAGLLVVSGLGAFVEEGDKFLFQINGAGRLELLHAVNAGRKL
jgi:hypothetical protein